MDRIRTTGDLSPGHVEGDYSVIANFFNLAFNPDSSAADISRKQPYDFRGYLNTRLGELRGEMQGAPYIPLCYASLRLVEKMDRGTLDYDEEWDDSNEVIDTLLDEWLSTPESRHLVVLGDFGTGKTTLCKHLMHRLTTECLASPGDCLMPLFIPLSANEPHASAEELLTDFLQYQCGVEVNFSDVLWVARSGRLCLILDGFDEMASRLTSSTREQCFHTLATLAQFGAKVMITGRPGFFPQVQEMARLLNPRRPASDVYDSLARELGDRLPRSFRPQIVRLRSLTTEQVDDLLRLHQPLLQSEFGTDWQSVRHSIRTTYNLSDLVTRPILLQIALRTIPKILRETRSINITRLYELYTGYWSDVEWSKGEPRWLLSSTQRKDLMRHLSMHMFLNGSRSIPVAEIATFICSVRPELAGEQLAWYEHDVRTCTFLRRTASAEYEFVHLSFAEYFVAQELWRRLSAGELAIWQSFSRRPHVNLVREWPLTEGVVEFLRQYCSDARYDQPSALLFYKSWSLAERDDGQCLLCLRSS